MSVPTSTQPVPTSIVRTDSRGRVSLGSVAEPNTLYEATVDENGIVSLVPLTVLRATEFSRVSRP